MIDLIALLPATWQAALQDNAFVESMGALFGPGREFRFLRPWWLLGLLLLPLLVVWWRRRPNEQGVWREAIDAHLLRHLLQTEAGAQSGRMQRVLRTLGRVAVFAGLALAFVALAGPSWRTQAQPLWQDRAPLVIALDLSERILATDLPPSRLQRARAEIAEILRRRGGGQMALVVYAEDAFTVTPLTEDSANIALYLDALHPNIMPGRGSRTDRGIAESAMLLRRAEFRHGDILVITDMLDGDERRAENAAAEAAAQGYQVSVLGLATESGANQVKRNGSTDVIRLDAAALSDLAKTGKGRYATVASDDSDLRALGVLDSKRIDATPAGGKRGVMAMDEGYWLLPLLMLAALFAFRRGVVVVALLCCLPWQPLQAADRAVAGSLWLRSDQQQHRQMQAASEAYRKNDYASAEKIWRGLPGSDAAYNRGNALARQGRYPEAIAAYDQALRAQPAMQDAIDNRRAVLEAMRKQQQNQNPPPKNQQGQNGKQQGKQNEGKDSQQSGGKQPNDQRQSGGQPKQPDNQAQDQNNSQNKQDASPQRNANSGGNQPRNGRDQNQDNRDQQGQNQQGQNQQSQNQQGQKQQDQKQRDQKAQTPNAQNNPQNRTIPPNAGQDRSNAAGGNRQNASASEAKPADPKAQRDANAAQRAQMDRALAQRDAPVGSGGTSKKPLTPEQRQQLMLNEARLRRVPDDPGGLLRAKFSAEDRRRSSGDERR
jgi:Ca-activated chloride channel homolog